MSAINPAALVREETKFDKICKCGNHMRVKVQKWDNYTICVFAVANGERNSCYLIGNGTVECGECPRRYRCPHAAYSVEARLWKYPVTTHAADAGLHGA